MNRVEPQVAYLGDALDREPPLVVAPGGLLAHVGRELPGRVPCHALLAVECLRQSEIVEHTCSTERVGHSLSAVGVPTRADTPGGARGDGLRYCYEIQ